MAIEAISNTYTIPAGQAISDPISVGGRTLVDIQFDANYAGATTTLLYSHKRNGEYVPFHPHSSATATSIASAASSAAHIDPAITYGLTFFKLVSATAMSVDSEVHIVSRAIA